MTEWAEICVDTHGLGCCVFKAKKFGFFFSRATLGPLASIKYFAFLSVRLNPINVKMAEPIWSKFWVGPRMNTGKVFGCSKLQNSVPKLFDFCKILKVREKISFNIQTLFLFVLYCKKRRCSQMELPSKVKIEDGSE